VKGNQAMIRRQHSKDLKFKVALDALRGDLTIAQIVSKYGINESLVHKWKKQLLDQGSTIFIKDERSLKSASLSANDLEKLHATIGRLKLENDFLEQALSKVR
jgi:transposase